MAENNVNVVEGTQVPFEPDYGNMEIVPVDNDGELEEITPVQMALGTAIVGAVSIGCWELGKWAHKNFIVPLAEKIVAKAKAKSGKDKEDVIEGEFTNADDEKKGPEKDKYEKASEEIRKNGYKKK